MKQKLLSLALALALSLGLTAPALAAIPSDFPDVKEGVYYYDPVTEAASRGWISGYTDGRFAPADNVTYAQMCVLLVKAFFYETYKAIALESAFARAAAPVDPVGDGVQLSSSFVRAATPWYGLYCSTANSVGALKGTAIESKYLDSIAVSQNVSRYEMALMIYNAMKATGKKLPSDAEITDAKASIADWDAIPAKYQTAVAACKAVKIINGIDSEGTFLGADNMTRAQAAIVVVKLNNLDGTGTSAKPDPVFPTNPAEITRSPSL